MSSITVDFKSTPIRTPHLQGEGCLGSGPINLKGGNGWFEPIGDIGLMSHFGQFRQKIASASDPLGTFRREHERQPARAASIYAGY